MAEEMLQIRQDSNNLRLRESYSRKMSSKKKRSKSVFVNRDSCDQSKSTLLSNMTTVGHNSTVHLLPIEYSNLLSDKLHKPNWKEKLDFDQQTKTTIATTTPVTTTTATNKQWNKCQQNQLNSKKSFIHSGQQDSIQIKSNIKIRETDKKRVRKQQHKSNNTTIDSVSTAKGVNRWRNKHSNIRTFQMESAVCGDGGGDGVVGVVRCKGTTVKSTTKTTSTTTTASSVRVVGGQHQTILQKTGRCGGGGGARIVSHRLAAANTTPATDQSNWHNNRSNASKSQCVSNVSSELAQATITALSTSINRNIFFLSCHLFSSFF